MSSLYGVLESKVVVNNGHADVLDKNLIDRLLDSHPIPKYLLGIFLKTTAYVRVGSLRFDDKCKMYGGEYGLGERDFKYLFLSHIIPSIMKSKKEIMKDFSNLNSLLDEFCKWTDIDFVLGAETSIIPKQVAERYGFKEAYYNRQHNSRAFLKDFKDWRKKAEAKIPKDGEEQQRLSLFYTEIYRCLHGQMDFPHFRSGYQMESFLPRFLSPVLR